MVVLAGRKRRRVGFAAPFVLVTACGQAPPAAVPVEAPAPIDAAPIDAAPIDAPVDAAVPDYPRRAGRLVIETIVRVPNTCPIEFGPTNGHCNPPHPRREPRDSPVGPLEPVPGGTRLMIFISASANGDQIDVQRPPGRRATILRRDRPRLWIEVDVTPEEIQAGELVLLAW